MPPCGVGTYVDTSTWYVLGNANVYMGNDAPPTWRKTMSRTTKGIVTKCMYKGMEFTFDVLIDDYNYEDNDCPVVVYVERDGKPVSSDELEHLTFECPCVYGYCDHGWIDFDPRIQDALYDAAGLYHALTGKTVQLCPDMKPITNIITIRRSSSTTKPSANNNLTITAHNGTKVVKEIEIPLSGLKDWVFGLKPAADMPHAWKIEVGGMDHNIRDNLLRVLRSKGYETYLLTKVYSDWTTENAPRGDGGTVITCSKYNMYRVRIFDDGTEKWYLNGKLHNGPDGFAIRYGTGGVAYYLYGKNQDHCDSKYIDN
jgi:hypothetical protein